MAIMDFFRTKKVTGNQAIPLREGQKIKLLPHEAIGLVFELQKSIVHSEEHQLFVDKLYELDTETVRKVTLLAIGRIATKQRELAHRSLSSHNMDSVILSTALNWHYSDMLHNIPSILEGTYFDCGERGKVKECLISELLERLHLLEKSFSKNKEVNSLIEWHKSIDVEGLIKIATKDQQLEHF